MKKTALLVLMLAAATAAAAVDVALAPIAQNGPVETVVVSSIAYTSLTSPNTRTEGLSAVYVKIPTLTLPANPVYVHVDACTGTNYSTSTVQGPFELTAAAAAQELPVGPDECLWAVAKSTMPVLVQGVHRRR